MLTAPILVTGGDAVPPGKLDKRWRKLSHAAYLGASTGTLARAGYCRSKAASGIAE
jgi:hypothetical protein